MRRPASASELRRFSLTSLHIVEGGMSRYLGVSWCSTEAQLRVRQPQHEGFCHMNFNVECKVRLFIQTTLSAALAVDGLGEGTGWHNVAHLNH